MNSEKKSIEVCFSPALYRFFGNKESIVVVVDILRATSSVCTAFKNGVKELIPVGTIEEALQFKEKGYTVAAERDGKVLDFADFGNSPDNFSPENVEGKCVVYSTTNGTQTIQMAADEAYKVVIGAYLNISVLYKWLVKQNRDIVILCAAWKNKFNIEDSLFAGALSEKLMKSGKYTSICDSAAVAMDLWAMARKNPIKYLDKAAQRWRLKKLELDYVIPFCHTRDIADVIPVYEDGRIVNKGKQV